MLPDDLNWPVQKQDSGLWDSTKAGLGTVQKQDSGQYKSRTLDCGPDHGLGSGLEQGLQFGHGVKGHILLR